ncbi:PD-(D/E)XK nuclease-like domain-containing protein [Lysinibacillus sp. NPDC096418]|uniref:PD-(D/E)XK nuclease-like domain-containing protein n=1 Tax=Lysinibacillus sp. NPDC096418 TaxID=3364138 RepID=UPI00381258BD
MQTAFQLNKDNYHSNEANQHYMSVSQFKSAVECEAKMIAELKGEYTRPFSTALTVGSYLHAAFENKEAFEEFCESEKDVIFKKRGSGKYAEFEQADKMIETVENDPFCMHALTGEKEVIFTGELFGAQWKIKVDNINHEKRFFSDIKTTQELSKRYWSEKYNGWVSFVEAYDYVLQMAIYREIIHQNTGYYYTPYIVAVTKETPPDKAILHFDSSRFELELEYAQEHLPNIITAKSGEKEPKRCEKCDHCRVTKQLKNTFEIEFLLK